ncbi:hypothetical protein ACHAXR_010178 [Thalassiosira sp. AJA248-18]
MILTTNFLCAVTFAAGIIGASSFLPIHHEPRRAVSSIHRSTTSGKHSRSYHQSFPRRQTNLFAQSEENENVESTESGNVPAALPPATDISSLPPAKDDNDEDTPTLRPGDGTTALFIDQKSKRVLIEELGYKRSEVERLRPELAQPILTQRMYRPNTEELPDEWLLSEDDTNAAMIKRLEDESKYPLKFPLLGISLVLFGKGLSDALITIIKVNIDFPGASLTEQFMGVPVLAIDAVCVVVGVALASWTWKTMKN